MSAVFSKGNTVGAYYMFTISKSYLEFCSGIGSGIPVLSANKFAQRILFVALLILGSMIMWVPFHVFFQNDRS